MNSTTLLPGQPTTTSRAACCPLTRRQPHWYRGAIVRGGPRVFGVARRLAHGELFQAPRALALSLALGTALLAAGCGGGTRQDAGEPSATFEMKLVHASFPAKQSIARPTSMELEVQNTGSHTVPNVAVTVDSFDYAISPLKELAANKRPIWAIEQGPGTIAKAPVETQEVSVPGGDQTAYVNTWALGRLAAGETATFIWKVVPVKPGTHTVHFAVAAGLSGKAKARLASGGLANGQFTVDIAPAPPVTHVDPNTGRIESGAYPSSP